MLVRFGYVHSKTSDTLARYLLVHLTVKNNQFSTVQLLIDFGANVNERNELVMMPLHLAAKYRSGAIVKLLLENGADRNIASELGIIFLAIAANFDIIKVAKMLLEGSATA